MPPWSADDEVKYRHWTEGPVDRRGRWMSVGVASLVGPLCALCALGVGERYAAVTAANAVTVVVLGVRVPHRGDRTRAAWLVMLAGIGALLVHNAANQVAIAATGTPATGVTSAVTLALGYGLLLVGGVLATAPSVRDPGGVLDAAIVGLAAATVMWGAVLSPAHQRLGSSGARIVYELSLVLVVTALTGVVARTAVVRREMRTAALYLLVAMVAADASDVTLTLTENPVSGLSAWWASVPCVVALIAFAVALLHPSVRATPRVDRTPARITPSAAGLPGWCARRRSGPRRDAAAARGIGRRDAAQPRRDLHGAARRDPARPAGAEPGAGRAKRLQKLASLDDLTGLPNRRTLTERLDRLLERVAAGDSPGRGGPVHGPRRVQSRSTTPMAT